MKLTCPDCHKPVSAEDVNIKLGIGKCLACDGVFNVLEQVGSLVRFTQRNMPLAKPKHYLVEDFGPDLSIRWRWYTHAIWLLVFFAIFWNGFLFFWYANVLSGAARIHGAGFWIGLLFPLIHVAVGIGITYACVASFINRTEIKLANNELSVWNGPLPSFGNRAINPMEIRQLFCVEKYRRSKHGGRYYYSLNVLLQSGERIVLVDNVTEPMDVLYLERTLEERLKLTDERVPGDWAG